MGSTARSVFGSLTMRYKTDPVTVVIELTLTKPGVGTKAVAVELFNLYYFTMTKRVLIYMT